MAKGLEIQNKRFVITGKLSVTRKEMTALIESKGGIVVGEVSGKTNYLIMGANAGYTKFFAAQEKGIPIIEEEDFLSAM